MKASIVVTIPDKETQTICLFKRAETTLGRSSKCSVAVSDRKLSRTHCRFFYKDDHFHIEDCGSTNGTSVEGEKIQEAFMLVSGTHIQIGDTKIMFLCEEEKKDTSSQKEQNSDTFSDMVVDVEEVEDDDDECIGNYELLDKIGQGGIGSVFRAINNETDKLVALKILKPEVTKDEKYVARFVKEAQACARLNHPNIIKTLDFGVQKDTPYLVLEYVASPSLAELIHEKKRLSPLDVLTVMEQIADALACSHDNGFIHRDIKPSNILVSKQFEVKVIDMGLVKIMDESGFTVSGQTVGTPRYMSPEQIVDAKSVDHRTDIYALGATAYHALSGKAPYYEVSGKKITDLLRQIYQSSPKPLGELIKTPRIMEKLINKAMARNPDERYRSAASFLKTIRKVRKKIESQ